MILTVEDFNFSYLSLYAEVYRSRMVCTLCNNTSSESIGHMNQQIQVNMPRGILSTLVSIIFLQLTESPSRVACLVCSMRSKFLVHHVTPPSLCG